jgi:hypothetical protein
MRKFFLKHCRLYRRLVCKLFGKPHNGERGKLSIPFQIYGDFDIHYLGYDQDGNVKKGFRNIVEALKNKGDLGLTVLYDKY